MHLAQRIAPVLLSVPLLIGCGGGESGAPAPPTAAPAPVSPKAFVDATAASGIAYQAGYRSAPPSPFTRYAQSGAAAGDYDNDGDLDLLVARGDIGPNLLYRNDGRGVFTDVAHAAGLAFTATATDNYRHTGPAFADMDGDGDLDVFLGSVFGDPPLIFANDGDGTFTNATPGSGLDGITASENLTAAFGDYDLDGDLDMWIAHAGTERDMRHPGDTEHLWRNDSVGTTIRFSSVSVIAGISPSILTLPDPLASNRERDYTFTASFVRLDDDLYPDIVSIADHDQSMVFMNNGDGTFTNMTDVGVITDSYGMGSTLGDYDDDGDLDWFVTAIYERDAIRGHAGSRDGNRFYRNDGGVFTDATDTVGVLDGAWGWAACFMDFENDGDLDIFHTNGWLGEWALDRSRAFRATGTGRFVDDARALGLDGANEGRGVVCADFDNDGDVDILELHLGSPVAATFWRNDNADGNHLAVTLRGATPNTEAAGARIYATVGSHTMMREVIIGNNFLSQNPTRQIFGLGTSAQVDLLRVEWPDGRETTMTGVPAGQTLALDQPR